MLQNCAAAAENESSSILCCIQHEVIGRESFGKRFLRPQQDDGPAASCHLKAHMRRNRLLHFRKEFPEIPLRFLRTAAFFRRNTNSSPLNQPFSDSDSSGKYRLRTAVCASLFM